MDRSQISIGEAVAGGAAALLFLAMFLPWYGLSAAYGLGGGHVSAWQAFGLIDLLLFLAIVATVAMVAFRLTGRVPAALGVEPDKVVAVAGLVALVLVLFRLLFKPGLGVLEIVSVSRSVGLYLGFLLAAAMAWGGWTAATGGEVDPRRSRRR